MQRPRTAPPIDPVAPCPFLGVGSGRCRAAFAPRAFDRSRSEWRCQSDDHDSCPLFMARLLRSSPVERTGSGLNLHLK